MRPVGPAPTMSTSVSTPHQYPLRGVAVKLSTQPIDWTYAGDESTSMAEHCGQAVGGVEVRGTSRAEIRAPHCRIGGQLCARSLANDASRFEHVGARGRSERLARVLLHE